ncbi:TIR-NBS-LRR RCT1 resistance protein [Trifolium medium]|uniref:TIR-NBS-LRR RCT1 resistance protein n=1 Tax=Trifolium medium TaxID=97028 RepID=A0A392PPS8_9FABA|nr:TIR-NBS-LRR RCT1 resistance protein [Trifolium medium]
MERCHVRDEEDFIVSGIDDNNVGVSDGDNEALNSFGEGTLNHMQITRNADVVGPIQQLPHYLDQPTKVVAEEIRAAEAQRDLEHQVPPPEGEPEQQPTVAPEAIEPTLGAQILDALRELRADFARQEQTVTARLNAIEVRLDGLEDAKFQIPRGSNSESTDIES